MSFVSPKTALISLSDKANLEELVNFLISENVKILSTGGTYNQIKNIILLFLIQIQMQLLGRRLF